MMATATGQANIQTIAYSYAQFHAPKVTNVIEALNLILSSEGVFVDLIQALTCYQVQENRIGQRKQSQNSSLEQSSDHSSVERSTRSFHRISLLSFKQI